MKEITDIQEVNNFFQTYNVLAKNLQMITL